MTVHVEKCWRTCNPLWIYSLWNKDCVPYWLDVESLSLMPELKEHLKLTKLVCFPLFQGPFTSSSSWAKRWLITLCFTIVTVIFIICKWIKSLINSWDWSTTLFTKYSNAMHFGHVVKQPLISHFWASRILARYFK